jgi:glycosyltransferase involved in cell wall biosynthesis
MAGLFGKFERERKRHGLSYALRRTVSYLADPVRGRFSEDFAYFCSVAITDEKNNWNSRPVTSPGTSLRINWVIPDMDVGSGGHMNIFRVAKVLEQQGHDQHFYVYGRSKFKTAEEFAQTVRTHFQPIKADFTLGVESMRESDALIATNWHTAYPVYEATNAKRKFYMAQDFEPWFYPKSSAYVLAENTYRMNLARIANGKFLDHLLSERYKMPGGFFEQAYDEKMYFEDAHTKRDPNLVIYYARPATPRRGWELALYGLKRLKELRPETRIVLFGYDLAGIHVPFEHESVGVLNARQLGALYRQAQVALVCSLTNYSIAPQELMASGCLVVDIESATTRAVFSDQENCLLAKPHAEGIAQSLKQALDDKTLANRVRVGATKHVTGLSWQKAGEAVEKIIRDAFGTGA